MAMKRGEVWWADLPAPVGRRPVLLLSRDRAYSVRNAVTVAFLTTTVRQIPVEVAWTIADGVPKDCIVNLDVINTIPKSTLSTRVCVLSQPRMAEVAKAIRFAIDL
jgi:mRNA interferase MazF